MSDLPISRRRAETRHRLMEAALAVFGERGVLAASVEEICERASFSRGAFYSNFESKNELVLALLRQDAMHSQEFIAQVERSGLSRRVAQDPATLVALTEEAVRSTFPTRREDRDRVMAISEIRLYAAREPGIREAYLTFRKASKVELLAALRKLAQASNWEFTIPDASVIEVLDALYERAMIKAVMLDPDGTRPDMVQRVLDPFVDVMIAVIRPLPRPDATEAPDDVT